MIGGLPRRRIRAAPASGGASAPAIGRGLGRPRRPRARRPSGGAGQGRRRERRSAATRRIRKIIVWPVSRSRPMTTKRRTALTSSGQPATTLIGVRMTRIARTTSWNRKQPRPGTALRVEVLTLVLDRRPVDRRPGWRSVAGSVPRTVRSPAHDTGGARRSVRAIAPGPRFRAATIGSCTIPTTPGRTPGQIPGQIPGPTRPSASPGTPSRSCIGIDDEARSRGRPSERSARRPGQAGLDYLYREAFRRAMGEPAGYAALRRVVLRRRSGRRGRPGPGQPRRARRRRPS